MAPHVSTPTSEGEDTTESDYIEIGHVQCARLSPISHVTSDAIPNGHNGPVAPTDRGESLDHPPERLIGTPSSITSYEAAYIDGYKDGHVSGYQRSHIELKHQPIAIIGMSCRFPGDVSTPDEFWELLARSRTGFTSVPPSRFSAKRFFHPNPGKSGTMNARGGNFLTHDLRAFDAPFFGFTQQEAVSLDPQQRLLLECTFEALESAGIPRHEVVGTDVGVFVGGTFSEYEADLFRDPETIPMHQATGCAMAMQSNRISHFFDFRGPSFTVDTACSSSLVALHTACQSLRNGESGMAVAAGVHLNMLPEFWISYSMSRLFGETGRSFAFDQRGTGYGRGEGCGMVILKLLDQAIKDNDPIRAVITGSGINQDGKTPGITMPNGSAQEALIRSVYEKGGMDPLDTGYVEAHGTGTRVGDPIESAALHSVFGEGRGKRNPLYIGSVKSNIGHLEAAAGIAGVIKAALMLERGFILPNYDFKQPNEKIPFEEWGLKVPVRQQPWPIGKRWASVNGFGFGGTNAHVVLTRGPLARKKVKEEINMDVAERLFVLSTNDKASTEKTIQSLGIYLEQRPEVFQNDLLSNLAYTLGQRKSLHPWRVAIVASSSKELVENLSSGKIIPTRRELDNPHLGWVFTGQGAQWWAMGRELGTRYPVYVSSLEKADIHLRELGARFSLLEELQKDECTTQVNAAHISQPACTAVQLALVDLLLSWEIRPSAVVGHSSGEIGAAYAAGIITFEDAMTVAYHRGRLVPVLEKRYPAMEGSMMAVGAGQAEICPLLDRISPTLGQARIACVNSPASVTVSGDKKAVEKLQSLIEEAYPGTFARKLQVDTAYHSHHMNLVAKEYTRSLVNLEQPKPSNIPFHSSLLGRTATSTELDSSYWVQNLTCTVLFDTALQSMFRKTGGSRADISFLVEIGPHAALQGPIKQILKYLSGAAIKIPYQSALVRKKDATQTLLALAGALFVRGAPVNMGAVNFPTPLGTPPRVLTDLPCYSWNHSSKYYHESRLTKIHKFCDTPRNDIIGVLAPYSNDLEPTWRNIVRLDDLPWLRHHQIQGVTIFPISGFVIMALEALSQLAQKNAAPYDDLEVTNLNVIAPVLLSEEELELTMTLRLPTDFHGPGITRSFTIFSWSATKGWVEHCIGIVSATLSDTNEVDGLRARHMHTQRIQSQQARAMEAATKLVETDAMYQQLSEIGVSYGATFRGLLGCRASSSASTAEIAVTDTATEMPHHEETAYTLHPVMLEQLITMYWPILDGLNALGPIHLPTSIGKVTVSARMREAMKSGESSLQAFCEPLTSPSDAGPNVWSAFALDAMGQMLISVEDLQTSAIVDSEVGKESQVPRELCYKVEWEPISVIPGNGSNEASQPVFNAHVVIIHGDSDPQRSLAFALSDHLSTSTRSRPTTSLFSNSTTVTNDQLCIFIAELHQPILSNLSGIAFEALQRLLTSVQGLLWVVQGAFIKSNNPDTNMVTGLSRTLRSEGTLAKFVTLDLDTSKTYRTTEMVCTILDVFFRSLDTNSTSRECEFMEQNGNLLTPRIVNDTNMNIYVYSLVHPPNVEPACFTDTRRPLRGILRTAKVSDSLVFEDDNTPPAVLSPDEVELQVRAIGISPRDCTAEHAIGFECSGVILAVGSNVSHLRVGDRAMAITPNGSLATVARAQADFVGKIPGHISFDTAASLPLAFCTAVYALVEQAKLLEGETLLVHDAASAAGQAALSVAQMIGAQVWATVRSNEEKSLLMFEHGIPEHQIWFLGGEAFAESIDTATNGRGVDVVFNTFTGTDHRSRATWNCIAAFGRFINVGAMAATTAEVSLQKHAVFIPVDIFALAKYRQHGLRRTLTHVARLLRYGLIQKRSQIKTFGISECAAAWHSIQKAGPHGKVVIVPRGDEFVSAPRILSSKMLFRKDATYVLIGGTGGLGRSIAKWMVAKGARNIILLSRSGYLSGDSAEQIALLNKAGANIVVRCCDVADRASVDNLLSVGLSGLPPVRGVVHGAMVLRDVLFEQMTHEQYTCVMTSKVQGAWNFHNALSEAGAGLDFFVLISSAAGAVGNRGQAAYAAANTFLNGFAQYLRGKGIAASSLDLTAVSDVGHLAEDAEKAAEVARNLGGDTISEVEVLALIQAAVEGKLADCNGHCITGMRILPTAHPFWATDAKFLHLLRAAQEASPCTATATKVSWNTAFRTALSGAEAEQVVCDALMEKIAEIISVESAELVASRPLSNYPLDSLTAIDLRNFITRMFEANLQVLELLASANINTLAKLVCSKSKMALQRVEP